MTLPSRLSSKIEVGDCWEWQAAKGHGYGAAWWNGRLHLAHRLIYQFLVGPLPEGLQLDHLCRNRACVNPDHLEPVTSRENRARSPIPHNHGSKTHCSNGHEFTISNTRLDGRGWRYCRTCNLERTHRFRAKKQEAKENCQER